MCFHPRVSHMYMFVLWVEVQYTIMCKYNIMYVYVLVTWGKPVSALFYTWLEWPCCDWIPSHPIIMLFCVYNRDHSHLTADLSIFHPQTIEQA